MNETAGHVRKVAKSCVVLEPPEPHKDVSDVLLSKLTLDALVAMQGPKPKGLPVPPKSEPPVWEDDEDPSGERQKDPRPSVQMLTSDVGKNVAALDQAIASHIPDVFQRALQLVEVIAEKKPGLIPIGAPSLRVLTAHSAETHISEKIRCVKWREPSKTDPVGGWVACRATHETAILPLLAYGRWAKIRPIVGVTESPMLRPDGTVLQVAGYDPGTGYLYRPCIQYPPIPDAPTQADAIRAMQDCLHASATSRTRLTRPDSSRLLRC